MIEFIALEFIFLQWDSWNIGSFPLWLESIIRIGTVLCILMYIGTLWKILEKSHIGGWQSILPLYNNVVFLRIINMYPKNVEFFIFPILLAITPFAENAIHWFIVLAMVSMLSSILVLTLIGLRMTDFFDIPEEKKKMRKFLGLLFPVFNTALFAFGKYDYIGEDAPLQESFLLKKDAPEEEKTQEELEEEYEKEYDEWLNS